MLDQWKIESLFRVPVEDFVGEDGNECICIFNSEIDAVTFVSRDEADELDKAWHPKSGAASV